MYCELNTFAYPSLEKPFMALVDRLSWNERFWDSFYEAAGAAEMILAMKEAGEAAPAVEVCDLTVTCDDLDDLDDDDGQDKNSNDLKSREEEGKGKRKGRKSGGDEKSQGGRKRKKSGQKRRSQKVTEPTAVAAQADSSFTVQLE